MKTYETIEELLKDLNVGRPSIHPEFHIFKFSETSNITQEALEPHLKKFFTIDFYAENQSKRQIGHTELKDLNNCLGFNSPLQLFSVEPFNGSPGTDGYSILFASSFFKPAKHQYEIQHEFSFFKLNSNPVYKLNDTEWKSIKVIVDTLYSECINNDSYSIEIVRSYLFILLNQAKRVIGSSSGIVKVKRYQELTASFEELILKEPSKYRTISEYADELNVTPIYLSECIKKATGLTAKKVLSNYMVLKAKSLLIQTTKSVEEVAYEMGFDEATNFIKSFKNNVGITPAAFRNLP